MWRPAHFCCGYIKGSMCLIFNVLLSQVRYRPDRNDFKSVDEWMKGWTVGQTAWQLSQCNSIIGTGTGELRSCVVRTTKDRPSHFTPRFTPSPYKLNRSHFGVRTLTLTKHPQDSLTCKTNQKNQNNKKTQETLMATSLHPPQHRLFTPLLSG